MIPVVFINCKSVPYTELIMAGKKKYETRTRNTLKTLTGKRVLIAETGKGKPVVKCSARIEKAVVIDTRKTWNAYRKTTCVPKNGKHDWTPKTKVKYLYELKNVIPVPEFIPKNGKRHGRTWMEYNGKEGIEQ